MKQILLASFLLIAIIASGQQKPLELKPKAAPDIPLILRDSVHRTADEYPTLTIFNHIEDYEIRQDSSVRAMLEVIYKNIKYPLINRCGYLEGMVVIGFIIEKNGTMTNVHIRKDIGGDLGEEAMRIMKLLPKFSPAMKDGKAVRFQYYIPVRFRSE